MKTINGNLIFLASSGKFDVIVHGCNCFCTMGSGMARQIRTTFPKAWKADQITTSGDINKMGTLSSATTKVGVNDMNDPMMVTVVNAYTQFRYGKDKRHVNYDSLRSCFKEIKQKYSGMRIGFPLIGAGLAGGNWNTISKIIDEELSGEDYTLVILLRNK